MKYDDIIELPHHQSVRHPHLSMAQRSAQFASFAALKGFEEEIAETARVTDDRIVLDEDEIQQIDEILQYVQCNIGDGLQITVTYFVPDKYKSGGSYVQKTGTVKRIDTVQQVLTFADSSQITVSDIVGIQI